MADPERPRLSVTEAAEATRTSRSTIRRRLDRGALPNAERDEDGWWRIPVADLLAAGLPLHRPAPGAEPPADPAEVDRLRADLAEQRRRADVAEAELRARREQVADLRHALAALDTRTGGPSYPPAEDGPQDAQDASGSLTRPDERQRAADPASERVRGARPRWWPWTRRR